MADWPIAMQNPFEPERDRAIVRVSAGGRTVYGVVTDGSAYSDLSTPMMDVLGADGDPADAKRMIDAGVDAITSNRPAWMMEQFGK